MKKKTTPKAVESAAPEVESKLATAVAESLGAEPTTTTAPAVQEQALPIALTIHRPVEFAAAVKRVFFNTGGSSLPILNRTILVSTSDDKTVLLRSTDLDNEVALSLDGTLVTVDQEGEAVLSAPSLATACGNGNAGGPATLTGDKLTGQGGEVLLPSCPSLEFPEPLLRDPMIGILAVQAGVFHDAMKRVEFCSSFDPTRLPIRSVLLEYKHSPNTLRLIATDGRRLAYLELPNVLGMGVDHDVLISNAAVPKLMALIKTEPGSILISKREDGRFGSFSAGDWIFATRLVEAVYPNYRQVIPTFKGGGVLTANAKAWLGAAQQIASLLKTSDKTKHSITIDAKGNEMKLSTTVEGNNTVLTVPCTVERRASIRISFAPSYLVEGLKAVGDRTVAFRFEDNLRPGLFSDGTGWHYVLMPMRLS